MSAEETPFLCAMNAIVALEDGRIFKGRSFGADGEACGEVVFNTSMAGYQEILTDPSYKGQIVLMTYPLIGNYGINSTDVESEKIFLEGFLIKELSPAASNWRSEKDLSAYLKENNVLAVEGIDTRALARHIRLQGAMKAVISTRGTDEKRLVKKAQESAGLTGRDLVREVTTDRKYNRCHNKDAGYKVVVLDCGVKYNILRELGKRGCKVVVVPARTTAEQTLGLKPDGVLFSNGPGDPAAVTCAINTAKKLIGRLPLFGICLGHQIISLALGARTYKLKFGHHGANHPVKDLRSGKVYITVQNHGFCVDPESLPDREVEITHINLNDQSLEGIRHRSEPVFSVQFHPEASGGPREANYLFEEFIGLLRRKNRSLPAGRQVRNDIRT